MATVSARDVWRYYDSFPALCGVSFDIGAGETFGILGENGAGKSTLLQIIATLLNPSRGQVSVNGKDTVAEREEVKSMIGYLPEMPSIYERLTGREFLRFLCSLRNIEEEGEEKIENLADMFEFTDRLDDFTGAYSKGIRQKVAIAGAMIHRPPLLVLDEPFSGLDPYIISRLKDALRQYVQEDATVVVSTHIAKFAEELCHRIMFVHKGHLLDLRPLADIIDHYDADSLENAFLTAVQEARRDVGKNRCDSKL